MCAALEHRGPDSRGTHLDESVGLGIQRLRIIDLETGDQPIFNEDGSVVVVLNGEIYNYRELRAQLERAGHRFATRSDTEVIVHLYEDQGRRCVQALHGMFAFAIWDANTRRLLLARDRVGKKPLFYAHRPEALSFASELGALLEVPEIPRELDYQALDAYLAFRCVPAPRSAFREVRKLPPASTLVLHNGEVQIERYWQLDYSSKRSGTDPAEVHEELREHIRRSVRRRMIADVPLGAFLSGGVDSSAVVAAMAEASPRPVKTFSIGFDTDAYNELPRARRIAELFSTDHHEFEVRPQALEILPAVVRHYGEPFADPSALASFYLSELARREVTVALNGDGGDESFGGYQRYVSNALLARTDRLPQALRGVVAAAGARLPTTGRINSPRARARRFAEAIAREPCERYMTYALQLDAAQRRELYTEEYRELVGASIAEDVIREPWRSASGQSIVDVLLEVDVNTYLCDYLLVKMDIATMSQSLEGRSPLLDHELMEFAASLPTEYKVHGLQKKVGLRGALRGWVPAEILDGPKRGFQLPIADWFRGELREYSREVLLDRVTIGRGWFQERSLRRVLDRHAAGAEDNSQLIWSLLMLELWHQEIGSRAVRRDVAGTSL